KPGHYGLGRANAGIISQADYGAFNLGNSSFTAECWMKTSPQTNAYTLVGKDNDDGYYYYSDFGLRILPGGGLRAAIIDTNKNSWTADVSPLTGRVDDNQWHHLALVCDRTTNRLIIYVDGVERA